MANNSLAGTTVLVTGGAGGLGRAIAKGYLGAGANVAVCDINAERLAATQAELEAAAPGRVHSARADVTDEAAVEALFDGVVARFGRLDVLVNNAGMADTFQPVGTLTKAAWDRVLNLNLTGSFLAARAAVRAMEKNPPPAAASSSAPEQEQEQGQTGGGGGLIIQIGSTASERGHESGLAYTVSKHGVAGLVKNTAGFYGPRGIYAVGLMLGAMIDTNIAEGMQSLGQDWNMEALSRTTSASQPPEELVKNAVKLDDVAKYCVFLSDRSIAATANGSCIMFNKNSPRA
ncbi:hypothetical protein SLS62_006964 [Diatrype stigma]|uniref:Uncharacterized protein n=1 Tax=Diatrype stigma TaxID=117547 RepID=A0AAN9UM18_9PEZI